MSDAVVVVNDKVLRKQKTLENVLLRLKTLNFIGSDKKNLDHIEKSDWSFKNIFGVQKRKPFVDDDTELIYPISKPTTDVTFYDYLKNAELYEQINVKPYFVVIQQCEKDVFVAWVAQVNVHANNQKPFLRDHFLDELLNILLDYGAVPVTKNGRFFNKEKIWPLCFSSRTSAICVKDRPTFTHIIQNRAKTIRLFLSWTNSIIQDNVFDDSSVLRLITTFKSNSIVQPKKSRFIKKFKVTIDETCYFEILKLFDLAIMGLPLTKHEIHSFMSLFYCFEHRKTHAINMKWVIDLNKIVKNAFERQSSLYNMPSELWSMIGRLIEPSTKKRTYNTDVKWMTHMNHFSDFLDPTYAEFFKSEWKFFNNVVSSLVEIVRIMSLINQKKRDVVITYSKNWTRCSLQAKCKFKVIEEILSRILFISGPIVFALMFISSFDPCYEFAKECLMKTYPTGTMLFLDRSKKEVNFFNLHNPNGAIWFFFNLLRVMAMKEIDYVFETDHSFTFVPDNIIDVCSKKSSCDQVILPINILLKSSVVLPHCCWSQNYIEDILVAINVFLELQKNHEQLKPSDFSKGIYHEIEQIFLDNDTIYNV